MTVREHICQVRKALRQADLQLGIVENEINRLNDGDALSKALTLIESVLDRMYGKEDANE